MTKAEAITLLTEDGNLRVPCSRYGRDSESCAEVAYAAFSVLLREDPETSEHERDALDHVMGLVVNDHDDIEYLIKQYGTADEKALLSCV